MERVGTTLGSGLERSEICRSIDCLALVKPCTA